MALQNLTTLLELKSHCRQRLGEPVINIETSKEQDTISIQTAIRMFNDFHSEGSEEAFIFVTITAQNVTDGYFTLDENIQAILELYKSSSGTQDYLFGLTHQLQKESYLNINSGGMSYFYMSMANLSMINDMLSPSTSFRFNRTTRKLRLNSELIEGSKFALRVNKAIIPDDDTGENVEVYNESWVRDMSTALIQIQWGTNLSKFASMPLPGGQQVDGNRILNDGKADFERLKIELEEMWSLPIDFFVG